MLNCLVCDKEFHRSPSDIKRRPSQFCSRKCSNKSRIKRLQHDNGSRKCQACGTTSLNFRPKSLLRCRDCENADRRKWYAKNRDHHLLSVKKNHIKNKYNLEYDEYQDMLSRGCSICGSFEGLSVDHDHASGGTRAILCRKCNFGLGLFMDSPGRLRSAANYLESHKS